MRWSVRVVACLLVVMLMAGCFDGSNPESEKDNPLDPPGSSDDEPGDDPIEPGEDLNLTPVLPDNDLEFVNCHGFAAAFKLEQSAVEDRLPPGFSAPGLVPGFSDVNLEVERCDAVILDNLTVIEDVGRSSTIVFVDPPASLGAPDGLDMYVFEIVVDNAAVMEFLAAQGAPVVPGTVEYAGESMPQEFEIVATGIHYAGVGVPVTDNTQPDPSGFSRKQHYGEGNQSASFWHNATTGEISTNPGSFTVTAEAGFLAEVPPGNARALSSIATIYNYTGLETFEKYVE